MCMRTLCITDDDDVFSVGASTGTRTGPGPISTRSSDASRTLATGFVKIPHIPPFADLYRNLYNLSNVHFIL